MPSSRREARLARLLDECLECLRQGETPEDCLSRYPDEISRQLEPMLRAALALRDLPDISPSDDYKTHSRARLMARLQPEATRPDIGREASVFERLVLAGQSLLGLVAGARRVALPVTLAVFLTLGGLLGLPRLLTPPPALASQCTLSILSGSVEVQGAGATGGERGKDGMTLAAGTRVRTAPDSHALLTFFEGSTLKLEPGTDVEIQEVSSDGTSNNIILKQWLGRTWSRVVKMADPGSHYEIQTPSASALVRGTLFATEVQDNGLTQVATTEGLVSVAAQGEEVFLPPQKQTNVAAGEVPAPAADQPLARAELVIQTSRPILPSVLDPTGASTGSLPGGPSFNQIPGSQSTLAPDDGRVITIPQPLPGEYQLLLRYTEAGPAGFTIQGKAQGLTAFEYGGTLGASEGQGWLVRLNIKVENGLITATEVSAVEPIGGKVPEKVVEPPPARPALPQAGSSAGSSSSPGSSAQPAPVSVPAAQNTNIVTTQGQSQTPAQNQSQNQTQATSQTNDKTAAPATSKDTSALNSTPTTGQSGRGNGQGQGGDRGGSGGDKGGSGSDKGSDGDKGSSGSDKGSNGDKGSDGDKGGSGGDRGSSGGDRGGSSDRGSDSDRGSSGGDKGGSSGGNGGGSSSGDKGSDSDRGSSGGNGGGSSGGDRGGSSSGDRGGSSGGDRGSDSDRGSGGDRGGSSGSDRGGGNGHGDGKSGK